MSKRKTNQYRLANGVALELGLKLQKNKRYRLNPEQVRKLSIRKKDFRRLYFDIENTPYKVYSWRIGYGINLAYHDVIEHFRIICISYKWENDDKVHTIYWDKNLDDKQLLIEFLKIADQADELVAHNGDRFDIRKIRTRCIYHRVPMFPDYRTLDTLKKSRAGFSFPNNKLDTIAQFLGVGAKIKHEGFKMWRECMEGDWNAIKKMGEYCEGDIVVLEDVHLTIQPYIKNNTHVGRAMGAENFSCPICGGEDVILFKNDYTAKGTIQRMMECNCGYHFKISNASWRNFIIRKSNLIT